jgi:ankyrin repeat protein
VASGDLREAMRLLAAGADPGIANRDGTTALEAAAMLGHAQLYRALAESDAHLERLLDQALEATFPASDPVAIALPSGSRNEASARREEEARPAILPIRKRR